MTDIKYNNAQSILEVILAVAIFSLISMVMVSFITGGFQGIQQGGDQTEAEALASEGIEAVRAVRDRAWNELIPSPAVVSISGSQWIISSGASELINNKYTRAIIFNSVCRDALDEIATCPGTYVDIHSTQVVVTVNWETREGVTNTVRKTAYLTNWDSTEWAQTDWNGGSGQSIWSDTTRYDSDDSNIDYSTVTGQVTLVDNSIGRWIFAGGVQVIDTTDSDFNSGDTTDDTAISGAGVGASIVLAQSVIWTEHADSGLATNQNLNDLDIVSSLNIWAVGNSGKVLHYNGTTWSEFDDMGKPKIFAIDMISSTDGWAIGYSGKIYHYNGTSWSEFVDTGSMTWRSIDMVSATDGWAVGESGYIYHYDGANWTEFMDTGGEDWYGVDMVSATDGWAVAQSGKILHYNGTNWSEVLSPVGDNLNSISMISSTDGWAVGDIDKRVLHYDGNSWTEVVSPTGLHLQSVSMTSATDGSAVGDGGVALHYDGINWSEVTSPIFNDIFAVEMSSFSSGWAVGENGRILQYGSFYLNSGTFLSRIFDSSDTNTSWDQAYWTEVLPSGSDLTIATRTGNTSTPDETWSAFSAELTDSDSSTISSPDGRYFQYRATLIRGDSASATPQLDDITIIYNAPTTKNLNDISIVSSSNIWAVGNSGKVLHYNGTTWSEFIDLGGEEIYAIDMDSASDGWTVGEGGKMFHYDGTTWSSGSSPTNKNLNDVFIVDNDDGWAVGDNGTIIYYDESWSSVSSPTNQHLNSLFMTDEDDGWAVGEDGKVLQANDGDWSEFTDTGDQVWYDIFMVSDNDGWMVGDSGRIWHYNGTSWSEFIDTGSTNWRTVYLVSSADGWAGGSNGELYHFDGNSWTNASSPTTRRIKSIEMIDTADGWAVGNNGTILQLTTEGLYAENGWLISSAFDMGNTSPVQVIAWDQIIPTCSPSCEVRFQLRTAPDASGSPGTWTSWYGATGAGSYFTNANGTIVSADINGNQWVQYRAELIGDGLNTAVLQEVRINYK
ncbi:hypothetical protein MYX06_03195 [Patescibacteria group bacterium AH-259-L05]|nr:hypothetical protein [Patescibacteria group bacterium AH-259-L05]